MFQAVPKMRPNTEAQNKLYALSMAETSTLQIPVPKGLSYLPYQIAGVEYAAAAGDACLFADPMGLGKTIEAIAYMNLKGIYRAVVITPTSVSFKWKREIEKWHCGLCEVSIFHPKTFTGKEEILILPYYWVQKLETIKLLLRKLDYQHLIIDECHFLKNPKAARTKHVLASNGLKSKAWSVHALSGTPITNRPLEIYPTIKSLCPQAINNMNEFEYGLYFCGGKQVKISLDKYDENGVRISEGKKVWQFDGASNMKLLGLKLRSHFMVRRSKEKVLTQLPDKFPPNIVYLNVDASVKKFDRFDDDFEIERAVTVDFTEMSAIRRELGEAKIEPATKYIAEQLEAGHEKIVVFIHHSDVGKKLEIGLNALGFETRKILGETAPKERDRAALDFQNEARVRVFIGSVGAAGVGIDLTAASYVIIVEPSWVPGENEQAIDRCHRIGQTRGVQTDYLVFDNTIDSRILKYLISKTKNIKEILGV